MRTAQSLPGMDAFFPRRISRHSTLKLRTTRPWSGKILCKIRAGTGASKVRVVHGRNDGNGFRSPSVQIAKIMGNLFQLVGFKLNFVQKDDVVRGPRLISH